MSTIKTHSKKISGFRPLNSRFILALFWITIIFQLTMLKHIWAIERLSRFFNSAALLLIIIYAAHLMFSIGFNKNIWFLYILPGFLVFAGMLFNFTLNSIANLNVINYFGLLLPWATYLAMPGLLKRKVCDSKTLWRYFYYFMLTAVILGILEYYRVFAGIFSMHIISTPNGEFLAGRFSILHLLKSGGAHHRFYACFGEPGSLAMLLIPVMVYAFFCKKYIGLFIFILALYLSESLGGIIAVALSIPLLVFVTINKRKIPLAISSVVLILVATVIVVNYKDYFTSTYERKQLSADVRETNVKKTIINLPDMIVNNPIGFELTEGTSSASESRYYYGSNFTPGNMLQMGGLAAMTGYLVILLISLVIAFLRVFSKNLSLEEKVVFISLIVLFPFIFQRSSVWDSAIFAFLFAPSIINFLQLHGRVSLYPGAVRLPFNNKTIL